jgi:hypothetical protein
VRLGCLPNKSKKYRRSYAGFIFRFRFIDSNKHKDLIMVTLHPLRYTITHAHWSIGHHNRNTQPLSESAARLMHLRVYDSRDTSHQSTPSPSLSYSLTHTHTGPSPRPHSSRSHTLRYFGFLSVWPGLQFPVPRPLGLDLLYVYPHNQVCARRFRSSCFSV